MKQHGGDAIAVNSFLTGQPAFLNEALSRITGKKNLARVQLDFQNGATGNFTEFKEAYTALFDYSKKVEHNFQKQNLDKENDVFYWNFTIYYTTE